MIVLGRKKRGLSPGAMSELIVRTTTDLYISELIYGVFNQPPLTANLSVIDSS